MLAATSLATKPSLLRGSTSKLTVVVPSNEAVLFFLFHGSAGIVESLSENENGAFLQSGETDSDDPHQSISMTAISVGGHGLGT